MMRASMAEKCLINAPDQAIVDNEQYPTWRVSVHKGYAVILPTSCQTCGIVVIRVIEPFHLEELLEGAKQAAEDVGLKAVFGNPVLLDFRKASLHTYTADDFRRTFRKRMKFTSQHTEVPYAMVASSDVDFGMLRMYGAYAEIAGLRSAENSLVTKSYDDAIAWVRAKAGCPQSDSCREIDI